MSFDLTGDHHLQTSYTSITTISNSTSPFKSVTEVDSDLIGVFNITNHEDGEDTAQACRLEESINITFQETGILSICLSKSIQKKSAKYATGKFILATKAAFDGFSAVFAAAMVYAAIRRVSADLDAIQVKEEGALRLWLNEALHKVAF